MPTVSRTAEQPRLRSIAFATNQQLVYLQHATFSQLRAVPAGVLAVGQRRFDYWRSAIFDIEAAKSVLITRHENLDWGLRFVDLVAPIANNLRIGRMQILSSPYRDATLNVYDVSLASGKTVLHTPGTRNTRSFAFDASGEPVARIDVDDRSNVWSLYAIQGNTQRLIARDVSETGLSGFAGLTPDGKYAFVNSLANQGRQVLFALKPEQPDAMGQQVLLEHQSFDVAGTIEDVWQNTVIGGVILEDYSEQYFLEPHFAAAHASLKERLPKALIQIINWSADRRKMVVYLESGGDAGGFFLLDASTKDLQRIAMRYPDLKGEAIGKRIGITFPARDGTRIPAYLTSPIGISEVRENEPLPTVVLVHGGPVSRDTLAFDWWASFLASRGYLVVQPNFRGSGGYGEAWELAGRREWGRLMQDDVEDAVHSLVRSGLADPRRVCIVGASYGGYAALVGATRTPDLFRCAASIAGVSDLPRKLELARKQAGRDAAVVDWWTLLIGDPEKDRPALEAASPAFQAHKVVAPILLVHGANDTVVPIEQSERMEKALRAADKDVEFVRFPGEDHWLSDASTRTQMLRELDRFLSAHIGRGAAKN